MSKKIEDYLPFYLGCEIEVKFDDGSSGIVKLTPHYLNYYGTNEFVPTSMRLFLRPLSDMTEEDVKEWGDVTIEHTSYGPKLDSKEEFGEYTEIYPDGSIFSKSKDDGDSRPINGGFLFMLLLKKGFDLFGLIESGLAIDKSLTTKQQP